jgi:hypothetical protein
MVLDTERGQRRVLHAFYGLVIEIDVRDPDFRRQAIGIHRESMILRGNLHLIEIGVEDRLT